MEAAMADVACFGDLLIDFVPTVTGKGLADAPGVVKAPGGAAANVAVGLVRLGTSSAFIGKVGEDPSSPCVRMASGSSCSIAIERGHAVSPR